jgi:hypothetical protein
MNIAPLHWEKLLTACTITPQGKEARDGVQDFFYLFSCIDSFIGGPVIEI